MGRKVHPYGFRLGVIKPWRARWYAEGDEYGRLLQEDLDVRELIRKDPRPCRDHRDCDRALPEASQRQY